MTREHLRRRMSVAAERWATIVLCVDGKPVATWALCGCGVPTLATVDALARLHLDARRLGWNVVVDDATTALVELLEMAGLTEVLAA